MMRLLILKRVAVHARAIAAKASEWMSHWQRKPVARPVFQGWQNSLGGITRYMRASFMLHCVTIIWVLCVLEKIDQG